MKLSLNWLKDYIDISLPVNKLRDKLTAIGFDIENVESQSELFNNFVIGKVTERIKHPNADKLSLCKVDIGEATLTIVCGAPNVDAGQMVCVAKAGAIIPNGGFEIKRSKIRGEFSEGMICSAKELNMGEDHAGIMVLNHDAKIGQPFSEYLNKTDTIIDISITPNRGDLLSHIGVSREIAFLTKNEMKIPVMDEIASLRSQINEFIEVVIENQKDCHRYCGLLLKNVKVRESPDWIKERLTAVGLRPINNIVDITNYIMMEIGQPLHAFDYNIIAGKKIIIKSAKDKEKFKTLDAKERVLNKEILMICDAEKEVGIAGIMGGENSVIKDNTDTVFIESAYFNPVSIRKSSKYLGLQTDSSYRFERGIDIEKTDWACIRAANLMIEYAEAELIPGMIDNYPVKHQTNEVILKNEEITKLTGVQIKDKEVDSILSSIGINSKSNDTFVIPSFRENDLKNKPDLIEEVIRLYGYDKIPQSEEDRIYYSVKTFSDEDFDFAGMLRNHFTGRGFKEIVTNSLIDMNDANYYDDDPVEILNASSSEMNSYRNNLYTGSLYTIKNNFAFYSNSLKLFEIGNTARYRDKKINESKNVLLTMSGQFDLEEFTSRSFDLFDMKGELQVLLEKLHIDNYNINYYNYNNIFDFKVEYAINKEVIAEISQFSTSFLKRYDIEKPVIACELRSNISSLASKKVTYNEISKFPPVLRDISFIIDKKVKVSDIENIIKDTQFLVSYRLFDIFKLEDGKISYAFELKFQTQDKTLKGEEVNSIMKKLMSALHKNLNAEIRK